MVNWTVFKNHLLEVDVTQNQETMALRMLTAVDLFNLIMCDEPHEHKFIEIVFGWGPSHIWLHTIVEGPWPHYVVLEVSGDLWTLFWGALTISWSWLLACVWSGPNHGVIIVTLSVTTTTLFLVYIACILRVWLTLQNNIVWLKVCTIAHFKSCGIIHKYAPYTWGNCFASSLHLLWIHLYYIYLDANIQQCRVREIIIFNVT